MQFFVLFIIGAVIVGAGAMLSPAWPSEQPRIGLAAALALALVVGGAVFWAELFGWDTLVIDYLLFALMSTVILGGTMAQAQERADARGEELLDEDMGWPGPQDLVFFSLVAVLFALPLFHYAVPAGQDAAALSLVTLAAREGGSFTQLAPFYPEIQGFIAPGFHGLAAYLSQQLGQPIATIYLALGSVTAFLATWLAYDLGAELHNKRLGRALALAMIASLWLTGLLLNGDYPLLMGLAFTLAFLLYALRSYRQALQMDWVGAGLMLGAVLFVAPALFAVALLAYVGGLFVMLLNPRAAHKRAAQDGVPAIRRWLGLWGVVPLVAVLGTSPWLLPNLSRVGALIVEEVGRVGLLSAVSLFAPLLAGAAVFWAWEALPQRTRTTARRYTRFAMVLVALGIVGLIAVLPTLAPVPDTTWSDVAGMRWLQDNSTPDSIIWNVGDPWVMSLSGRQATLYAVPPGFDDSAAQPDALEAQADYIFVPANHSAELTRPVELVHEQDGTQIYRVVPDVE